MSDHPRILITPVLLLAVSHLAFAQGNSYINLSVREGLPSSEVYQVIQDKKGFLWFATDNGVARYDGRDFKIFNSTHGLTDPVVFGVHEDRLGRIWFRTFTGKLSYYQDDRIIRYPFNDSLSRLTAKVTISDLYYDNYDQLWITSGERFTKIDAFGNYSSDSLARGLAELRRVDSEKEMLAFHGPTHRLGKIKIDNEEYPVSLSDSLQTFGLVCQIKRGRSTYISINRDLFEYDGALKKIYTSTHLIISLSVDKENKLWIGHMNGGVKYLKGSDFSQLTSLKELDGKSVTKVLSDDEQGLWITTLEKGVFYFPNLSIQEFFLPEISKLTAVGALEDEIIVADHVGVVLALSTLTNKILWRARFNHPITSLFINNKTQQIWVSTTGSTSILNSRGEVLRNDLPSSFIDFQLSGTNILGINTKGIYTFDFTGNLVQSKKLNMQFRNLLSCKNQLYMGGKNGLFVFDSLVKSKREIPEFTDIKVFDIIQLNDSSLLISTIGNGFYVFNKKTEKIRNYSLTDGFIANNIYSIILTTTGIWFGTERGVATCTLDSLIAGTHHFNFLSKGNGLMSNKINLLTSSSNKIWAFSDNGYNLFSTNKINYSNKNPKAYIKEITINDLPFKSKKLLTLKNHENNLQIKTGFLSFNNQNLFTRYRIDPSQPWISSDNYTYTFNSLVPGLYHFEVEQSIDNKNWKNSSINIDFKIGPPWWATWYFRIAVTILLAAITFVLYKRRIALLQEKNDYLSLINEQQGKLLHAEIEATERERSRIAKDLHDGISIDLVSIKLITDRIAKKVNPADALEVETQVQKTVGEIRNIIHGLNPPGLKRFGLSATLLNYSTELRAKHSLAINYDFQGTDIKNERLGTMIFRILQELTTNSIKHAQCKAIDLHINVFTNTISIAYADNGIGFDPVQITKGFGLSNIESRVTALGGQFQFESGEYGTSYSIDIPLHPDQLRK